eukprot:CAMPEP_0194420284 /NCGR_PEP_ID=MMETSP0176-20130528/19534_1 /TAXON_ID=216777 /ORGANISM="Proboscia alata, Strain PI-D3" /LENGTH=190 /DNA_ID=CAMNT_0039227785 /DNA_START=521 /DNA_END=1093 /DNA_ORIENTATION=-
MIGMEQHETLGHGRRHDTPQIPRGDVKPMELVALLRYIILIFQSLRQRAFVDAIPHTVLEEADVIGKIVDGFELRRYSVRYCGICIPTTGFRHATHLQTKLLFSMRNNRQSKRGFCGTLLVYNIDNQSPQEIRTLATYQSMPFVPILNWRFGAHECSAFDPRTKMAPFASSEEVPLTLTSISPMGSLWKE